jgi:hypothetical protein
MLKSKKKVKVAGLVVLLAGVFLFVFAKYEQYRVGNAKSSINRGTSMFSGNAVGSGVGRVLVGEASQYDTPLKLCSIGGIILVVLGAGILYFGRKKR